MNQSTNILENKKHISIEPPLLIDTLKPLKSEYKFSSPFLNNITFLFIAIAIITTIVVLPANQVEQSSFQNGFQGEGVMFGLKF